MSNSYNIAVITSRFNETVTQLLFKSAMARLTELGVPAEQVQVAWVPGAVELPLIAQQYAKQDQIDAVICLGAVIRGETSHYDYVCEQASNGCLRVALDYDIPVIFGVLTTENAAQALARANGTHSKKGKDAVDAAFEMIALINKLTERLC